MSELMHGLFQTEGYHPHGFCYLWQPGLVWLHVVSDAFIGLAYLAIGISLALFVRHGRGQQLPFSKMFVAFGIFIAACGATHFVSIWTLWSPMYWFSGGLKAVTALASVITAIALPPLVPVALGTLASARASERNRAELEDAHLRLKEMDRLKTRFFANVSHELRTPLTLILGPVGQILREDTLDSPRRRRLETIEHNAQLLLQQVNDLLDIAKLDAGRMEPRYERTDLAHLTHLCVGNFESLATVRGLQPLKTDAPEHLVAEIDLEKMRRVLFNLLANALKFTPAGGEVWCRLHTGEADGGGEVAVIEVHDSGPGVPPDQRAAIFEPYRQVEGSSPWRPTGTGLGLAIAAEMVNLHHGSIRVDDSPLGGAAFIVEIPLKAPSGALVHAGSALADEPAAVPIDLEVVEEAGAPHPSFNDEDDDRPRVLVVEDNVAMSRFIAETLEPTYRVIQAFDGKAGAAQAAEVRPDLIVSDVMMPEMTGEELVSVIRSTPELDPVPIILLSARADEESRLQLLQRGAQDYLTKPFPAGELRARVANWLGVKRVRDILQAELDTSLLDVEELAAEIASRKRELEQALEVARSAAVEAETANRAKSDFLGIMSHELRTPLNAIFGYVDLLETGLSGELNEKQRQYVQRTRRSAEHLLNLVDEILTFARIEAGAERPELERVDLKEIVNDAWALSEPAAVAKGLSLTVALPEEPVQVRTDPDRLRRILLNLLSNAVKFTDEGTVHTQVEVSGDRALVTVRDTGPGIPIHQREAVFQPFWQADASKTRKAGGTGLGLAIARELSRLLDGELMLESEEGVGSSFTLSIPLAGER